MAKVAEFESRRQFARWIYQFGERAQILLVIAFRRYSMPKAPVRPNDKQYWVSYKARSTPVEVDSASPEPEPKRRPWWSSWFR